MTQTRGDFRTGAKEQPIRYSDFLPNFDRNPITGALAKITNERSVKNALTMLVRTQIGERPFQSWIGSAVTSSLFENLDPVRQQVLKEGLITTIRNCEPRVNVIQIRLNFQPDRNLLGVTIVYQLVNTGQVDQLSIILKRVR